MTPSETRELVTGALQEVAPDLGPADLADDGASLRDDLRLDSLDFLNFVEALGDRTGLRIEEDDYPRLATVGDCVAYLAGDRRTPPGEPPPENR
ncbi:hypothetical protein GCM10023085_12170 [Actinomadura viridis]|uniref:Acyl carrier protein n=1 Tax=Actinomadura viridis TaxID=58110 RepID=A0A931DPT0_9ACTN|nr:acyl carrier protein [Actinomadura viridis]MBG6093592.1 acyl carrier protein [Actinomadura viridis]